ncbi:class I SAM-dependent methyltransferase [Pseudonocardia nematodicida]|uniref:Class I SAM-dependent methyltransferase n=1 Tax=Pseudonocardia nematodicida TaxID=1206997 RepID=A0ABV1KC87_9PSEU
MAVRQPARLILDAGTRAAAVPLRGLARLRSRPARYAIGPDADAQRKYGAVMDTLAGRRFRRVLEVGCGEGELSARLAGHAGSLLGVDLDATAVGRAARRVPSGTFVRRALPHGMPGGTFDLIVCADVLHHWDPVSLRVGVAALLDRLEPGGALLAYHSRQASRPGAADRAHRTLRATAALRGLGIERREIGAPGPDGAHLDLIVSPLPATGGGVAGVPAPRRPVAVTPAGSPRT